MRMKFTARKGKKMIIKLFLLSIIAYIICLFINQQIKIKIKSDELNKLNEQIAIEKSKSEDIKNQIKSATDSENPKGGKPDRRVFENVAE